MQPTIKPIYKSKKPPILHPPTISKEVETFMKNIKFQILPITIMFQHGLDDIPKKSMLDGFKEFVTFVHSYVPVNHLGLWRANNYVDNGVLIPEHSVDWYMQESKHGTAIDGDCLLNLLASERWKKKPHKDLILIRDRLAFSKDPRDCQSMVGLTSGWHTDAIVSTYWFRNLKDEKRYEAIKTGVIHEIGHLFFLLKRNFHVENNYGLHCTNQCVMRQGNNLNEWLTMTEDRLKGDLLCSDCIDELTETFSESYWDVYIQKMQEVKEGNYRSVHFLVNNFKKTFL